jgi:hypothetical protein
MKRKIQQKPPKRSLQASRLNKPPKKLKELIDLVNCFPTDELKLQSLDPRRLRAQAEKTAETAVSSDYEKDPLIVLEKDDLIDLEYERVVEERAQQLGSKLQNYLLTTKEEGETVLLADVLLEGGIVTKYWNVWNANMRLHHIAQLALSEPSVYWGRSVLWDRHVPVPVLDKIDEQGFVRVSKDLFTEAMDEDDIPAARIRECEACKQIFWAGRITQKGCSARCGDVIRKRRYRERYKQGFYQGAKLTEKEKAALKPQKRKSKAKKGA